MDSIHLNGADDVARAGRQIDAAADRMQSAANAIDGALDRFTMNFQGILDQFIRELSEVELSQQGHVAITNKIGDVSITVRGDPEQVKAWMAMNALRAMGPRHGTADPAGDDLEARG